ncbi:N-acetyl sugar amidotransferase [Flavisolibacter ginsenosidimutans]|uniref:N-acetyl sugar amidotransferase n=1 Tax=Flavisolibacter ginsenosidimutans TaxID=661481 RepID=A0A5B8UE69_9BACT|nr:N-acetyl sugar amidotransferase [Flavisolibacter ginsenosidimutans]QEC54864.1 N-acetyl sugar amidotransferase [Flavisolibacter ginsenosidimutans]
MVLKTHPVPYRQCTRCILDTVDDPKMSFDENGVCSHCRQYDEQEKYYLKEGKEAEALLSSTLQQIKDYGRGRKYDCLIGLSGGVDSSYVAYLAKQYGLRALCVHFDNGWNSELAVMNIHHIVNKLNFDLETYVIDWEEFKDLQLAYLKASVIDIEVLTDHAIYGTMFKIARQNDIKYVLGGHNIVTEGILPYHWTYDKKDYINIKAIHKQYGEKPLKTFPFLDRKMKKFIANSGVEFVNYLNWVPYVKDEVKKILQKELAWKDYGGKHYESIWTRFYQGYILPTKFKVDKRKAHLSTLVCSGQMTREEALAEMKTPPYDAQQLQIDKEFVLKKFGINEAEFDRLMKLPVRSHKEFDTEGSLFNYYPVLKPLKPVWNAFKVATGK